MSFRRTYFAPIGRVSWLLLLSIIHYPLLIGCQGQPSGDTPIHFVPDMDNQPRYDSQAASPLFEDGSAMRPQVPGTVARGHLDADSAFYYGLIPGTNQQVDKSPAPATMASLKRGQERFNIYCAVCHGRVGDGKGIVPERGFAPAPSFHSDLLRSYSDGKIFATISHGVRSMPSYAGQIPVEDRWNIINYIHALQRSQNATAADVPSDQIIK